MIVKMLAVTMLLLPMLLCAESKTGYVHGDHTSDSVSFSNATDSSYTISASPTNGWVFTDHFSISGYNGWYKSGGHSASCETITDVTTVFIDAATAFGVTISGKMYKPGGTGGSLVDWSVSGSGSATCNPSIDPSSANVEYGGNKNFIYKINGITAPSGMWKYSPNGGVYSGSSSSYTFPPSGSGLEAGSYTVSAARNSAGSRGVSAPVRYIKVASVSAGTITSTTDSPGASETLYVARDSSAFNVTASPYPAGSWPTSFPTWKVNGTPSGTAGSATYSFNPTTAGTYTVAAFCGGSYSKAIKVIVVEVGSLQYEQPSDTWNNVSGTLYVARGNSLAFKAIPNPTNIWPTGQPTWGGSSGASGSGETTSVTFNTASTSSNDYKTVTATCGNVKTANIIVVEVASVSATYSTTTVTSTTNSPGASETLYVPKGASAFNVTANPSPSGSWPSGYPTWKLNGTAAGTDGSATYSFNPTTAGTYTVAASCGSSYSKALKIVVVEVASVSAESVTSTTDSPGANETIYVARDSSAFNVTASPSPLGTWPTDFPTWKVNGTSSGTVGSVTYSFDPTTAGTYTVAAFCGSSHSKAIKVVVVEVCSLQYEQPIGTWNDVSGTLYVARGASLTFKAIPNPTGTWPTGQPTWGGSSGASGTGETKAVTFNTASTSSTDYKTVTATCGNVKTANVIVVEVASVSATYSTTTVTSTTNSPGASETLYVPVGASAFNVTASSSPSGSWPVSFPTWKLDGTVVGTAGSVTYSFDPATIGTYSVVAFCGSSYSKAINIVAVTVDKIFDDGSGSFQESQVDNGDYVTYVQKGSQRQLKATPNPGDTWPTGYPKWFVGGQLQGTGETYTFQSSTLGMHTVSVQGCACSAGLCNTAGHRKDIKVYVGELKLYIETATGQVNDGSLTNLTECMEGRTLTYTAKIEGVTNNPSKTFTFYFQRANLTNWNANEVSSANSINYTVISDDVANSPSQANHMFTTPIHVSVKINNIEFFESDVMDVDVYELWINYFKDTATGKAWKVCVENNMSYDATASSDCDDWNWDMPAGVPDAWNPTGGNVKSGTAMKIPYTDLARASNSWFGDTYGEVEASCNDGEDNFHRKYSTNQRGVYVKADVFFPPTVNVNGGTPSTAAPPCWFVFWQQTSAGSSEAEYDHSISESGKTQVLYFLGEYINGAGWTKIGSSAYSTSNKIYGGNATTSHGTLNAGSCSGIDWFHLVVAHELKHRETFDVSYANDVDIDAVPDSNEVDSNSNGVWDPGETDPTQQNTHNISCASDDEDSEYVAYYYETTTIKNSKGDFDSVDWSKGGKRW